MSDWRILQGDVLTRLAEMPDNSVHCVVTSPPYFGLRDYGIAGQIGLEATPADFVAAMVAVFREVRRVLRPDGSCWCNLGDSYAGPNNGYSGDDRPSNADSKSRSSEGQRATGQRRKMGGGLKAKDLMLMPARVAIALQDDGWWVRSDIIWCKRSPMPESVTDRPTSAHEHIFLLTKSAQYYYDADAIREPVAAATLERTQYSKTSTPEGHTTPQDNVRWRVTERTLDERGRNCWNYWLLSPKPFPESHFATFPTEIPRRAILAGTSEYGCCAECQAPYRRVVEASGGTIGESWHDHEGRLEVGQRIPGKADDGTYRREHKGWVATCKHDAPVIPCTVLDPFSGAGTTVMVALSLGRNGLGIELNPTYVEMSERRIMADAPLFNTKAEATAA